MRWLPHALGALACLLTGIIGLELRQPAAKGEATAPLAVPSPPPPYPVALPAGHGAEHAAAALARPLFSEDRRPRLPSLLPAAEPPSVPRLTGTIIGPFGKRALLVDGNSDRPLVLGESGRMGVWTVEAISEGLVTLRGPDGAQDLRVSFGAPLQPDRTIRTSSAAPRIRRHSRT